MSFSALLKERVMRLMQGRGIATWPLTFLSWLYGAGVAARNFAYDKHILPVTRVSATVISIGNIVAGGAGKTPLVRFLAQAISPQHPTAIVSRGYGSHAARSPIPRRVTPSSLAEEVGDEPLWLARALPSVAVWVGNDKIRSAQAAVAQGAKIILLDDGFQCRKLYRDFDLVVTPPRELPQHTALLPRGLLRERPSRVARAHLVAAMGPQTTTHPHQVMFARTVTLPTLSAPVALFCAIADPHALIEQLHNLGVSIVATFIKHDHATFSLEELNAFAQQHHVETLLCTEKDFVKVPFDPKIVPVTLDLSIHNGHDAWNAFLETVNARVAHGT